jgi:hypothetical protein
MSSNRNAKCMKRDIKDWKKKKKKKKKKKNEEH